MEQGQRVNSNKLTEYIVASQVFKDNPFSIIDVGCSGGISKMWSVFEPCLKAYGIDPVISECERLNNQTNNKNIKYFPGLIGLNESHHDYDKVKEASSQIRNPFNDLSAKLASDILNDKVQSSEKLSLLNNWTDQDLVKEEDKISLKQFINTNRITNLDFIKIDIDGDDFEALLSLEQAPRDLSVCGFALEVNFYGGTNLYEHTFHNTDLYMRKLGYQLFDLSIRKYSLSSLPLPFEYDMPAQTIMGRPYQGDAIYLLDPLLIKEKAMHGINISQSPLKLLKLICIFECLGLYDHAARLILEFDEELQNTINTKEMLDILVKQINPKCTNYREYITNFKNNPKSLFRSIWDQ